LVDTLKHMKRLFYLGGAMLGGEVDANGLCDPRPDRGVPPKCSNPTQNDKACCVLTILIHTALLKMKMTPRKRGLGTGSKI
jgi:hypothetical protein